MWNISMQISRSWIFTVDTVLAVRHANSHMTSSFLHHEFNNRRFSCKKFHTNYELNILYCWFVYQEWNMNCVTFVNVGLHCFSLFWNSIFFLRLHLFFAVWNFRVWLFTWWEFPFAMDLFDDDFASRSIFFFHDMIYLRVRLFFLWLHVHGDWKDFDGNSSQFNLLHTENQYM